jgi:hypothetical protein
MEASKAAAEVGKVVNAKSTGKVLGSVLGK